MSAPTRPGDAGRRQLRQSTGSGYRLGVPPIVRKVPQHTFALDNRLWKRCKRIAHLRHETMSDVIRRHLVTYERKNRHLLDADGYVDEAD